MGGSVGLGAGGDHVAAAEDVGSFDVVDGVPEEEVEEGLGYFWGDLGCNGDEVWRVEGVQVSGLESEERVRVEEELVPEVEDEGDAEEDGEVGTEGEDGVPETDDLGAVSYTHLTLPTKRIV